MSLASVKCVVDVAGHRWTVSVGLVEVKSLMNPLWMHSQSSFIVSCVPLLCAEGLAGLDSDEWRVLAARDGNAALLQLAVENDIRSEMLRLTGQ